jgi:dipeptidyl aminopeptidase/acylaminoacyl peptidase
MHRMLGALLLSSAFVTSFAQRALETEGYILPPKEIADYFEQPRHLNYTLSNLNSTKTWFARVQNKAYLSIEDLSNPYENLAGLMIDVKANRARSMSYRNGQEIILTSAATNVQRSIKPPKDAWLGNISWSPDGKHLMYLVHRPTESTIYVYDVETNRSRQLTKMPLLAVRAEPVWTGDSEHVFAVTVPEGRGEAPFAPIVPSQPKVQVADKAKNRLRVYRSLLQNDHDKKRLEYLLTGQLVSIDVKSGKATNIGKPAMFADLNPSPKGDFARVRITQKPFSYIVPFGSFGEKEELWDREGKSLYTVSDRKLASGGTDAPSDVASTLGPRRNLAWHPTGNGLTFVRFEVKKDEKKDEKKDGEVLEQGRGAAANPAQVPVVKRREELVHWLPPFRKEDEKVLDATDNGYAGLTFSTDGSTIFVTETNDGVATSHLRSLSDPAKSVKLWAWKTSETDKNPGSPVTAPNALGISTLDPTNGKIYLRGTTDASTPAKARPFLDAYDMASKKAERVWWAPADAAESISAILDLAAARFVVTRQTATQVPNSYVVEGGKLGKALTDNRNYAPDLSDAIRHRILVTRADGFKFYAKVTLPAWHLAGDRLPAFFWFYPSEFESQADYDQKEKTPNPNLFPALGGSPKALLLRRGWAVIEPDCPIVGPKGRINDYYVNDLRNSLSAVIDELDRKGFCDRNRLAIGGHSYGGFSTANAMIHTPFFKAGIAGAGNYNRTLTPMAFQSETRTMFEARETYLNMSPILFAENLTGAMLMYAGMEDQNVGTDPINSAKMFSVLESIGKPAALYMYPHEDHGQVAKETLLDQWARWIAWLDKYVLGVEEKASPDKTDKPQDKK